jgi:hypothetical protein
MPKAPEPLVRGDEALDVLPALAGRTDATALDQGLEAAQESLRRAMLGLVARLVNRAEDFAREAAGVTARAAAAAIIAEFFGFTHSLTQDRRFHRGSPSSAASYEEAPMGLTAGFCILLIDGVHCRATPPPGHPAGDADCRRAAWAAEWHQMPATPAIAGGGSCHKFAIDVLGDGVKPMAVTYSCEGCGVSVTSLALFKPPAHGFCIQCAFLCAYVPDPVEMVAMRKALDADRREGDEPVSHRGAQFAALADC